MLLEQKTRPSIESSTRFEIAGPSYDAQLRRLLRENPMPGNIALSIEREPSYFAGTAVDGSDHQTIVAMENGRAICAGSISVRPRFLNGIPTSTGYLGGLRLDTACRGRASVLRRGYQKFHDLHRDRGGPVLYLTSIFSGNERAVRFLERKLPGMPTYLPIANFVTLLFRTQVRRHRGNPSARIGHAVDSDLPAISALLNRQNRSFQFAPVWNMAELRACGELQCKDFQVMRDRNDQLIGCSAVWDQRAVRQTVVRGYSPAIRHLRPLINLGSRLLRSPALPAIGQAIPLAFASHVATAVADDLVPMLQTLTTDAANRGVAYLTAGFDKRDPRLKVVRSHFSAREYASRLYVVYWEDGAAAARSLVDGTVSPEVALL